MLCCVNDNAAYTLIDRLGITEVNKQNFLLNNGSVAHELFNYLQLNGGTSSTISLLLWSVDYLYANPTVTIAVFKNQFLSTPEGPDGDYDTAFWDDPNLSFQAQVLPSYSSFFDAFPKHGDSRYDTSAKMYAFVGGNIYSRYLNNGDRNTCALRVSRALNYSGVNIPETSNTFKGSDGKNYFLSALALKAWMKKTFGIPTGSNKLTGVQGGTNGQNFPSLLVNKKGIYIMTVNNRAVFNASGHADMLTYITCDGGCYFNTPAGITEILIWELN